MGDRSEKYKSDEEKLLIAKVEDKYDFCKTRNKITYTDFLNMQEITLVKKFLQEQHIKNYIFYGGKDEPDRSILIFYPEKLNEDAAMKNIGKILNVIRIKLPNELSYEHRDYLSGIMKLGIKREKFGDIIVTDTGADIVSLSEVSNNLKLGLEELTRFRKSIITIESIDDLENKESVFEPITIIVTSIRLDNFVSEIARCSRTRATEIIEEGRVFVNYNNELKDSKRINENDIINVRGFGKYIYDGIQKTTRSGRYVLNLRKYV